MVPPLSFGPERFTGERDRACDRAAYPFGETAVTDPAAPDAYFPECLRAARSFCLRVSGAVAPSAPAMSAGLSRARATDSSSGSPRSSLNAKLGVQCEARPSSAPLLAVELELIGRHFDADDDDEIGARFALRERNGLLDFLD